MKRIFVEFSSVTRVLRDNDVSDDAIRLLQRQIMEGAGDVIAGTGGLRQIRCAGAGRGKSGVLRLIFADYPEVGKCLLVAAFAKNVKGNLSPTERNQLSKAKAALDKQMRQIAGKAS